MILCFYVQNNTFALQIYQKLIKIISIVSISKHLFISQDEHDGKEENNLLPSIVKYRSNSMNFALHLDSERIAQWQSWNILAPSIDQRPSLPAFQEDQ